MYSLSPQTTDASIGKPGVVMCIEFVHTNVEAQNIISKLKEGQLEVLHNNTMADFAFITCYSLLFLISFLLLFVQVNGKLPYWVWWILFLVPGMFDVIENTYILQFVAGKAPGNMWLYLIAVRAKWIMSFFFILVTFSAIFLAVLNSIDWIRRKT